MVFSASGAAGARERERARATKSKKSWNLSDGWEQKSEKPRGSDKVASDAPLRHMMSRESTSHPITAAT